VALATVEDLGFAYGTGGPVLHGVSLEIEHGEHVALLGSSGSGKSTLLRALAGLVPHFHGGTFSGRVVVGGSDTRESRPSELAGTVASVFQDPEDQIVMAKVANEVAFGLENTGVEPDEIWRRVEDALALVGVEQLADRPTAELSGGELQRVALASALALRPSLLLLDEPTLGLAPLIVDQIFELLEQLKNEGSTILLVEQNAARTVSIADRVYVMRSGGRLEFSGSAAELASRGGLQTAYMGL
jgi:energy-coupling factor transport system ATP-binding protein